MKKQILSIILLACVMSLLAGCETTFEQKGREVKFTASSRGSVSTKTAYGDETTDGYAIIMWEDNDRIRIYSPNTNFLIGSEGSAEVVVGEGAGQTEYDVVYDDYTIVPGDITGGHIHNATLENVGQSDNGNPDGRGLYWNLSGTSSENEATFYAAYPTNTGVSWYSNGLSFDLNIPNRQSVTFDANGVHTPSISSLPLLAMQQNVQSGDQVNLEFYPAFSAFEFNLKSEDLITLNSFTLETACDTSYVTGTCIYNPALKKKSGEFYIQNNQIYFIADSYWAGSYELCSKSLTVNFPSGTQIGPVEGTTQSKEVTFTLFALPNDLDQMSITVNLTTTDGSTKSRKLKLQQKDSNNEFQWITFPAGHKAKIKGLAVDKGATWLLDIDGKVLPWNGYDEKIKAQVTLQGKVGITGAIENTYAWQSTVGKELDDPRHRITDNHYETDGTYSQFYQVRTLNTYSEIAEADRYFLLTFTPTAPTGGYWELVPTFKDGDTESRNHFKFELQDRPNAPFKSVEMDELNGPILNSIVKIKIIPKNYEWSDPNTYNIWFKYYCRTSKTSAPISGDSEFQDVHGDGRFSYWTFRLGQYEGDFDPSSQAPASGN